MIELKNINKTFITDKGNIEACKNVNLTIQDGEIYGVIGYSGAGKSTLVRIINQLEKQTSGEVIIDGEDISKLNDKELRQKRMKIGMIFQHFNLLWSRTVIKNIELPLEIAGVPKEKRHQKAQELLELVGLSGREHAYPSELSGGQKQRVGIARALANDPTILLCDEATSALDPDTTVQILDLLKKINQQLHITIVMITHQMEVVQKICQKIAVMSNGEVVEEGLVKDLFKHPKHKITKRFVKDIVSSKEDDTYLKEMYPNGTLLRLTFNEENVKKPIISSLIKNSEQSIGIVSANISDDFGTLVIHIEKNDPSLIDSLVKEEVEVEVL